MPRPRLRVAWPRLARAAALAGALLAALPGGADARKFSMSGTWIARRGGGFVPLQFAATAMGARKTQVSMGNLSWGFGFPNGAVAGAGGVTATGSAPATLRVPRHRFAKHAGAAVAFSGALVQLTTRFDVDAPFASATLAPDGGPGSFTWCPGDPVCVDGPGTMRASDPAHGAGMTNGRVIYRAGANRFGGVIQLGLAGWRVTSQRNPGQSPPLIQHLVHGPGTVALPGAPGGPYGFTRQFTTPGFVVTRPVVFVPGQLIAQPGPKQTTMGGFTDTASGATLHLPNTVYSMVRERGFPATTGTVFVQQSAGTAGDAFFTVMGSDVRTALGAGNISVVSGGLTLRGSALANPDASFDKVRMTLAPPVPSLSPASVAAAAALVLLGAGYARRWPRRRAAGRSDAGSDEGSKG